MLKADFTFKPAYDIFDLLQIMSILRSENGCVWDREQDHHSIRNNFIEETYEAVEAIDQEDPVLLQEELGDVLLQVVFHTEMEKERNTFDFHDICDGICKKLIHRHPHVFGNVEVSSSGEVLDNWDKIKKEEKQQQTATSTLEGVSKALPSLMRSYKVQKRAAKTGFEYPDIADAVGDLKSELTELEEAMAGKNGDEIMEELGDLLFSVVNVARMLGKDPEEALYRSTDKFIRRFSEVENIAVSDGIDLKSCTIDEMNRLWKIAKQKKM